MLDYTSAIGAYGTIKRVLETIMEGGDMVQLQFSTTGSNLLSIHCVDALWVNHSTVHFQKSSFDRHSISQAVRLCISIKELHDFFRSCKTSKRVRFALECDDTTEIVGEYYTPATTAPKAQQLKVYEVASARHIVLRSMEDDTPYEECARSVFTRYPNFSMTASEFSSVILDLTVGGMEMTVTMHPNQDIEFETTFDTGTISHYGKHDPKNEIFVVHKAPKHRCQSGKFIVKFVKMICSMSPVVKFVTLYIEECVDEDTRRNSKLVIELSDNRFVKYMFTLKPYSGPRNLRIPREFIVYSVHA